MAAVSTHSRPKAAGAAEAFYAHDLALLFQLTAARRRLVDAKKFKAHELTVSTHSRPKAAGPNTPASLIFLSVSTHSRPKAAGHKTGILLFADIVSTHSRPKAAGPFDLHLCDMPNPFQLTAARRRLVGYRAAHHGTLPVSTHSRPKAAGKHELADCPKRGRFNSQPPEGGWRLNNSGIDI